MMPSKLLDYARAARGFMPDDEGVALYEAAVAAIERVPGAPIVEIGAYCGKSTVYLASAARDGGVTVYSVDHHRGSEENQPGWEWHEPDLVDPEINKMDTLPTFRRTVYGSGLEDHVVALVGQSPQLAAIWGAPAAMIFIDGGHGEEPAAVDYKVWSPHVAIGGYLAIHDVFESPEDGGQAPYEQIYLPALQSGLFAERFVTGSLRVLERV